VLADINVGVRPATPRHSSGVVTPMIMERLGWSIVMAEAAGESAQAAQWREQLERMKGAFRKFHVVPASGSVPLHVGDVYDPEHPTAERGYSQGGQLIAIFTALLSPEEARANLDYVFPAPQGDPPAGISRWNNPTMCYRALRALSQSGMAARAVVHMKERFSEYLPGHPANPVDERLQGPLGGPLPEYWISRRDRNLAPGQINTAQPNDPTGSHGWAAVTLQWLHESLLGVTIESPGGQRLRIAPESGGLPYVAGWTNTPHGPVHVYYDPQQWRVEITLPAGVVAKLVPPAEFKGKRVRLEADGGTPRPTHADGAEMTGPGKYVMECY
jgi:hypothetical protein